MVILHEFAHFIYDYYSTPNIETLLSEDEKIVAKAIADYKYELKTKLDNGQLPAFNQEQALLHLAKREIEKETRLTKKPKTKDKELSIFETLLDLEELDEEKPIKYGRKATEFGKQVSSKFEEVPKSPEEEMFAEMFFHDLIKGENPILEPVKQFFKKYYKVSIDEVRKITPEIQKVIEQVNWDNVGSSTLPC